jgi:integrase
MRVFKQTYTKAKNGVRVTMKVKHYSGRLKKATGETVKISLLSDKHSSQTMLASLQLEQDQIRAGVLPPQGITEKKSLLAYVDLFVKIRPNGASEEWMNQQGAKLKLVFGNSKFVYHTDVTKETLVEALKNTMKARAEAKAKARAKAKAKAKARAKAKADEKDWSWGNQTYNHYVKALNAFFNWLVKEDYIPKKPYKEIELEDTGKDELVHGRRAISNEEFKFLIESVENDKSKRHSKISKVDRINLYQIIFYTGLRAEELYQLKPECFDFSRCTITFFAGKTRKNKGRKDTLPLHSDLILKIKEWVLAKEKNKMLWNCWDSQYLGTLLKKDMVRARDLYVSSSITEEEKSIREQDDFLKWEDSNSLFADLHSLRTTFITNVSKVASPKQCQMLARHSSMETTFKYYVKTSEPELAGVIGKLPTLN